MFCFLEPSMFLCPQVIAQNPGSVPIISTQVEKRRQNPCRKSQSFNPKHSIWSWHMTLAPCNVGVSLFHMEVMALHVILFFLFGHSSLLIPVQWGHCSFQAVIGLNRNTITEHMICIWTHEIQGVDERFGRKYVKTTARTIPSKKWRELPICSVSHFQSSGLTSRGTL